MRTKPLVVLVTLVAFAGGSLGCDRSGPEPSAAPVASPGSDTITVPNVLHTDLQVAYRRLTKAGLEVSFGRLSGSAGYEQYATQQPSNGLLTAIDPAPYVGDMDPRPGAAVARGSVVAILTIECPHRLTSCD